MPKIPPTKELEVLAGPVYHRNGCCGCGFFVATMRNDEGTFVVIRPWSEDDKGRNRADKALGATACFVLEIDRLAAGSISFGDGLADNSWRGDHFSHAMDLAIKENS